MREYTDDRKVARSCTLRSHRTSQDRPRKHTGSPRGGPSGRGGCPKGGDEVLCICTGLALVCSECRFWSGCCRSDAGSYFLRLFVTPPQKCRQFYSLGILFSGVASEAPKCKENQRKSMAFKGIKENQRKY